MGVRILLIDTSWKTPLSEDSIVYEVIRNTHGLLLDVRYRFKLAMVMEYDYLVFLNPRCDKETVRLLETVAENSMKYNPRLSVFQFVPFVQNNEMKLQYQPSDLSLLALSGALSFTGKTEKDPKGFSVPHPPTNLLNSAMTAMAISSTINMHILSQPPKPEYKLRCIIDDWIYMTYFPVTYQNHSLWNNPQGENLLDGHSPFYCVYQWKDKQYITVGCIEHKFYKIFISHLPILETEKEYLIHNQMNAQEYRYTNIDML